ncbi:MAG: (2Fe-2S)-binding protein [Sandaracinaceae bacterium]|nr:(2Fe-2S)-binding protein [Sandaracinaceae bacterium]
MSERHLVSFRVNGAPFELVVRAQETLLEVLRYRLRLTGTKQGCDEGDCGACTVQLDGEPVLACLTLAAQLDGREVRTVEGLAGRAPHPLQDALDRHDAAQCGFCTPGVLMSAEHLLREAGRPVTREEAAQAIAGNLCRCTGYTKILDAIVDASLQRPSEPEGER